MWKTNEIAMNKAFQRLHEREKMFKRNSETCHDEVAMKVDDRKNFEKKIKGLKKNGEK